DPPAHPPPWRPRSTSDWSTRVASRASETERTAERAQPPEAAGAAAGSGSTPTDTASGFRLHGARSARGGTEPRSGMAGPEPLPAPARRTADQKTRGRRTPDHDRQAGPSGTGRTTPEDR